MNNAKFEKANLTITLDVEKTILKELTESNKIDDITIDIKIGNIHYTYPEIKYNSDFKLYKI